MKIPFFFVTLALLANRGCHGNVSHDLRANSHEKRFMVDEDSIIQTLLTRVDSLTKQMESLQATIANMNQPQVSFMAYLKKTVTGDNHHIYFDDVKLNIGNAFNPHHRMFVAPQNGTYQFMVNACSQTAHYVVLELVVNDATIGKVLAGYNVYDECSSN